MKTSSFIILLLFITLSINFISCESSKTPIKCGKVYDGLTSGLVDMNIQTSTSTIAANWKDFGDEVLFFEWAIISDSLRVPPSSVTTEGCYEDLRIKPNVMPWEKLEKQTSSAMKTNLLLSEGTKYHVLLRVTFRTGHQLVAMTDGVTIVPSLDDFVASSHFHSVDVRAENANDHSVKSPRGLVKTSTGTATTSESCLSADFGSTCSIDNENRCRESRIKRVSDYLNQIYGKAKFAELVNEPTIIRVEDFDDDEGDDYWILAPIIGFIFFLFLLALCIVCIVFICCNMGGGKRQRREDRPNYGDIEDNLDGKDYGNRGGVNKADTATNTKVEFPDTNIRRLSVDHNDEEEMAEEVKGTRRKHPITSSASSSFRDYRSVNQ